MSEFIGGESERTFADFEKDAARTPSLLERFRNFILGEKAAVQALPSTYVKAFDIYRGQGDVDFVQAKQDGYELVVIKASEALFKDSKFDENWRKAVDAGLLVMTYHFFRSNYDGKAQADFHLETTKELADAIKYKQAIALDIETSDGASISTRQSRAKAFWNEIALNNKLPGTYCSKYYWQLYMGNMALPSNVWGWVAAWTSASNPALPVGWTESQTRLWQYGVYPTYSWTLPVPGVSTSVDVDRWLGDMSSLYDFLAYETTPPISHSHLEYEIKLAELDKRTTSLQNQLNALQSSAVYFKVTEDLANTYRVKELNGVFKPVMVPANDTPDKVQYHKNDKVQIIPLKVDADSSTDYWKIVGMDLYLRESDGYIEWV